MPKSHLYNCGCKECSGDIYYGDLHDAPKATTNYDRSRRRVRNPATIDNPVKRRLLKQRPIDVDRNAAMVITPEMMDKWSAFRDWEKQQQAESDSNPKKYSCYHGLDDDIAELEEMLGGQPIEEQVMLDAIDLLSELAPDILDVALVNYALSSSDGKKAKSMSMTPYPLDEELEIDMIKVRG